MVVKNMNSECWEMLATDPYTLNPLAAFTVLLEGSGVVISRAISRITILINHIRGLITPHITTHEPPSRP